MPTILITGANRGIGFEFVRQYAADKWQVVACCREPGKAKALQALAKDNAAVRIEALEVTDAASIAALAERLQDTAIDVLINNAGIYSGTGAKGRNFPNDNDDTSQTFGSIDAGKWLKVFEINSIAPVMMIQALLPSIKKGAAKKIVNITSSMGSLATMNSGSIAYRSSKTALNAAMRVLAHELTPQNIIIANLHPGWVQTDMGGARANLTPEQSVTGLRDSIAKLTMAQSGQFLNYDGQIIAW